MCVETLGVLSISETKAFTLSFLTWLIYCQMAFLWKYSGDLGTGSERQRRGVRRRWKEMEV